MCENLISFNGVKVLGLIIYPDFHIPSKKITFISGSSGSGKSSILRICNGTMAIDSGIVKYCGKDILDYDILQLRREVLLVAQSPFLFEGSVYDNFVEYYAYRDKPCPEEKEINFYLDLCKILIPLNTMCESLSGGEQQRIFIALFLSFNPLVLMLDEPTAALDPQISFELMDNITAFCKSKNMTLIVISHNQDLAKNYADHTISLTGE